LDRLTSSNKSIEITLKNMPASKMMLFIINVEMNSATNLSKAETGLVRVKNCIFFILNPEKEDKQRAMKNIVMYIEHKPPSSTKYILESSSMR
jgi:hypothetical protein